MKNHTATATVVLLLLLAGMLLLCGCTGSTGKIPPPSPAPVLPATTVPAAVPPEGPSQASAPALPVSSGTEKITITSPRDGDVVDYRTMVKGTSGGVAGSSRTVSIVILPEQPGNEYWVQPDVVLLDNGNWSVLANFGNDATAADRGKKFTVYAVLSAEKLPEGKMTAAPAGIRQMIEVTRG